MGRVEGKNQSALDWLRGRRDKNGAALISIAEFDSGDRLRRDFVRAKMMPRVTSAWSMTPGGRRRGGMEESGVFQASTTAARERVRSALASVGPDYANVLIDVCCLDRGLRDVRA